MPNKKLSETNTSPRVETQPDTQLLPNDEHPDYLGGTIGDDCAPTAALTPTPDGPPLPPFPWELPPQPLPRPIPMPIPKPWPIKICGAVSGRYTNIQLPLPSPGIPGIPNIPVQPLNKIAITVRVDVDRFFPQNLISIEASRIFPRTSTHAIAEVTSDQCLGLNNRRITATITYRDGNAALLPGDQVVFVATRGRGVGYESYSLTLGGAGLTPRSYALAFKSQYFDPIEFEIDRVANAGAAVTTYATGSHPNHPPDLPAETLSLSTVYQRAGFDVTMSPNTSVIPVVDAGANGIWSDSEMHNAMVTYWSRFADRPQWALWVLFAARHDQGRSLGGIMFDDIGPNHRQGTAIFTDSFIQDVTPGDVNPNAWRQRMVFWTAIHEMGHAFNLAHAWQKALGNPWIPLTNQPESRSFMNYPFRVQGGEVSFFSDFRFRFTDEELFFMRHAPRRFVKMGNSDWFVNHGFEKPGKLAEMGYWALQIRPNRETNGYRFLEPVVMELKLTNISAHAITIDEHILVDGRHITIFIQREGGTTRQWQPMITSCHEVHETSMAKGASTYGAHTISASTGGWLIDDPGFYKVQAAIDIADEIVVSNVLRLYVAPPVNTEESALAPDYFTEDVARAIQFTGAPALPEAMAILQKVMEQCADNPAALHAAQALSTCMLRDYKRLDAGTDRTSLAISSQRADITTGAKMQLEALMKSPEIVAETLGHINYFGALENLATALSKAGDDKGSIQVQQSSIATMKKRNILAAVVRAAESRLKSVK